MNKNIIKGTFISLCGYFIMNSCSSDLLQPYIPGALSQEGAISSPQDLAYLLNTAYSALNSRNESVEVSVFTDEAGIGYANGGQGIGDEFIFQMNPQSTLPNAIWAQDYIALGYINRVIAFALKVPIVSADDKQSVNLTLAQAYALRAYCHLQILSYFTTDMTSDTALAGILADQVFDTFTANNRPRATNAQFYSLIQADCNKSIALYNALVTPVTLDKTAANKMFATGLKARAYEYKGDYPNAEMYANQVIAQSGLILANNASDYQSLFFTDSEPSNAETIFRFKRTGVQNRQTYNLHNGWCSIAPNFGGSPFYEIGRSLYNKLAVDLTDVRYRTIVAPTSKIDTHYANSTDFRNTDVLVINKHGGTAAGSATAATTAGNAFTNDIKVMRLSEMYLMIAEARAAASDLPGAANAVSMVRTARLSSTPLPAYSSQMAAWKGILDERRIEFAFEGYRFIDLKRIGAKAGAGIDRDAADYSSSSSNYPGGNPANLPLTSFKFALPIPIVELTANNVIIQNPGY